MPICIAGMHRSGTSMIAGLLKQTGVYLGADRDFLPASEDNPAGHWEHFGFYALNERLLLHFGAGWDVPDLPDGWASRHDLSPFREGAWQLIERMRTTAEGQVAWGWKDPRNSITIQFWKTLLPDLRVVVCVRNPLAVAGSLERRNNMSFAAAGRLWLRYYRNLLHNVPAQDRVVTLYESYFADPRAELTRVLGELGVPTDGEVMTDAVDPALHHHRASFEQLLASDCHPDIIEMYSNLCAEVRVADQARQERALAGRGPSVRDLSLRGDLQRSRFHAEIAQREEHMRRLAQENATLQQLLEDTRTQLSTLAREMRTLAGRPDESDPSLRRLAEQAVVAHGLAAHAREEFSRVQGHLERPLKEAAPLAARLLGQSQTADFVYRLLKRVRWLGTMLMLQREVNDATTEALGVLTQMASAVAGPRAEADTAPPGLERKWNENTRLAVPELMESLRTRLSRS